MRAAVVLLFAFALPVSAQSELELLVAQLGSNDYSARNAAYQRLLKLRNPQMIPLLVKAAPGYPEMAHEYTVILIAQFPPKRSGSALRKLAKSDSPHLRVSAAVRLLRSGDRNMIPIIVEALRRDGLEDATIGNMAMRVRSVGHPEIYAALRGRLTTDCSEMNIYSILDGFSLVNYRGAITEAQRIVDADKRSGPRAVAATYLIASGRAQYAKDLAAIIASGGADVTAFARISSQLARARVYPDVVIEAVIERAPEETNHYVIAAMIRFIAEGSKRADTKAWLEKMLEHEEGKVAVAAMEALAKLKAAPDRDALLKLLAHEDDELALVAARLLRRMDDASGLARTIRIAQASKANRSVAVQTLGEFRHADAVEPLIEFLNDPSVSVRINASLALSDTLATLFPYRRFEHRLAYDSNAPEADRKAAIDAIRAWWNDHKQSSW